jgi:hypothetical protein
MYCCRLIFHRFVQAVSTISLLFSTLLVSTSLYAASGSVFTTTVEYTPIIEPAGFASIEPWGPVFHYKDSTYLVQLDAKYRPWITQVTNGKTTTVPLDVQTDYMVQADGHNRFSIGVDKNGYVHVTGDMHHYSVYSTGVVTPYPTRYQKQIILYWKSNKPNDVTGGFTFRGDNIATAIPGGGWLIGHFFADNNGELYYASQAHAFEDGMGNNGQMAVGLYTYNASTQTWKSIGAKAPLTSPTQVSVFPVFYWENAGSSGGWFQNYQPSFRFDSANNLHFALSANTNSTLSGSNRLLYAMSPDGGVTWKKANGAVIPGLPLRGIDGQANTADVVLDTGNTNFLDATIGLAVDKNNKIGITQGGKWIVWTGSAWSTTSMQNYVNLPVPNQAYRLPTNDLVFNVSNGTKLLWSANLDSAGIGYDFTNYKGYTAVDDYSVRTSGVFYGMALNSDNTESVLKTVITPAPLPTGWQFGDIETTANPVFGGNAGFLNNQFTLTSYGTAIEGNADSFTYAYTPLTGDGTIVAKVTAPINTYGRSGLMMREDLTPAAKDVSVLLNPQPNVKLALFQYRTTTGGYVGQTSTTGISPPYWLKLARVGNVFTGFISPDGTKWTQINQTTVAMNSQIYVGLVNSSYQNHWYMQTATFDNVSAPAAPVCTRNNPSVSISPSSQKGAAGTTANYALSIINNDTSTCGASTFNLGTNIPKDLTGTLDNSAVSIAPGATGSATLKISSVASLPSGSYTLTLNASNAALSTSMGSATATYAVTGSCVYRAPTMWTYPAIQWATTLSPVNYTVYIFNNDTSTCAQRLFQFSSDNSSYLLKAFLEPYNVFIAPGTLTKSVLTMTPSNGLTANTYTNVTTSQNGGSAQAQLIYIPTQ